MVRHFLVNIVFRNNLVKKLRYKGNFYFFLKLTCPLKCIERKK